MTKEAIHLATRTANVMARVEPDVKEQAEDILDRLGVPASVVINALYKQIIYRNGIPFSLVLPSVPVAVVLICPPLIWVPLSVWPAS